MLCLILALGCGEGGAVPAGPLGTEPVQHGDLEVITTLAVPPAPPAGYDLTLNGAFYDTMAVEDTLRVVSVPVAVYRIGLTGVTPGCKVGGGNPRGIRVDPGVTTRVIFVVKCAPAPDAPTS